MLSKVTQIVVGLLGTAALIVFILGLANSISTGFAGFWGGLPFWIISLVVLGMALFNFYEVCIRRK